MELTKFVYGFQPWGRSAQSSDFMVIFLHGEIERSMLQSFSLNVTVIRVD